MATEESDFDDSCTECTDDGFSDDEGEGGEENDVEETLPASPAVPAEGGDIIEQRKKTMRKYVLLDCRPKKEYDECHIYGSIHLDEDCWTTGEVASVIEKFKVMTDCHFALVGGGPDQFDLGMSVNAHRCGPSKSRKRKQRIKNQASE